MTWPPASPAGFTLDGPRGPRCQAQPGAVWLAKATGNPVLPFHIEAARHWTMRSWDRTQVPKPFSLVALAVGAPVEVPRDADDAVIEAKRTELERVLGELQQRAQALLAESGRRRFRAAPFMRIRPAPAGSPRTVGYNC